ncbi:MAG: NAD(P)-binding protein [Roseiflexaceae bacterium]|nr:NAD(P)-binding protein [Roseiflexaceae bacterium]
MPVIDIVGGGILGLALGYDLIKRGIGVRVWERSHELGGLMGRTRFDELNGLEVDRYYHAILSSDRNLMRLFDELGLRSELRMTATLMGFYHNGKLYSMSTPLDFLRFPPLSPIDRVRLGVAILRARRVKDWRALEQIPVVEWLTQLSGR